MSSERTVAILGASTDRGKFGNKSVRAHQAAGWQVFPVNPKAGEIEGLPAYSTLAEIPVKPLDRISVYLPPSVGIRLLEEIQATGASEVWLNPGSDSREIINRSRELEIPIIAGCSIVDVGFSPAEFA